MARPRKPDNAGLPKGLYARSDGSLYWINSENGTSCSLGTKDRTKAVAAVQAILRIIDKRGADTDASLALRLTTGSAWIYERPKWARSAFTKLKHQAKVRNIPFDLSFLCYESLLVKSGGRCALSGIVLDWDECRRGDYRVSPWRVSVDRIDSRKGYAPENCRVVCLAANLALNEWGESVLLTLASHLVAKDPRGVLTLALQNSYSPT